MVAFVRDQRGLMSEARSTVLAAKWLSASVRAHVHGQFGWASENFATPWMVACVLLLANGSLHRVRCWRWGHRRFCRSCRSHVCHKALLAVRGHCIQNGARIHRSRNWWSWQRIVLLGFVEACFDMGAHRKSLPMNALNETATSSPFAEKHLGCNCACPMSPLLSPASWAS